MTLRSPLAAFLLALALAGCATTEGEVDDAPPSGANSDEQVPATNDESEEEPEEAESEAPVNPSFGQAYTWDNGLTVTVSKPKQYQPGQYAAGAEGKGTPMRFTVTVVNNTGDNYEVVGDYVTVQSGNEEASQIFDSEKGLEGQPSTKLIDGREAKYDIAFMVKNPNDIVMEYQPSNYELASALFVS